MRLGRACVVLWSCAWLSAPTPARAEDRVRVQPAQHRTAHRPAPLGRQELRRPNDHPHYLVELEPHLLLQWFDSPVPRSDVGVGLGFRASIPVLANGPIPSINNNLAVSFGLDWAHFGACRPDPYDCSANDLWFPFAVQWNFFITEAWSVFPEVGFALHYASWSWEDPGPGPGPRGPAAAAGCGPGLYCEYSDSRLRLAPVTWLGTRFSLSDFFSFTLRVGVPSLVAGVSFRL